MLWYKTRSQVSVVPSWVVCCFFFIILDFLYRFLGVDSRCTDESVSYTFVTMRVHEQGLNQINKKEINSYNNNKKNGSTKVEPSCQTVIRDIQLKSSVFKLKISVDSYHWWMYQYVFIHIFKLHILNSQILIFA